MEWIIVTWLFVGLCAYIVEMLRQFNEVLIELANRESYDYLEVVSLSFRDLALGLALTLLIWPVVVYLSIKRSNEK